MRLLKTHLLSLIRKSEKLEAPGPPICFLNKTVRISLPFSAFRHGYRPWSWWHCVWLRHFSAEVWGKASFRRVPERISGHQSGSWGNGASQRGEVRHSSLHARGHKGDFTNDYTHKPFYKSQQVRILALHVACGCHREQVHRPHQSLDAGSYRAGPLINSFYSFFTITKLRRTQRLKALSSHALEGR